MPFGWFKNSSKFNIDTNLDKEGFYVITAIFNPASYQSRYTLYHQFAQHMKETGAQLITIECIFPTLNQHEFQVTNATNPYHIQLKSESIYWMKENLINIAVSRLPPNAKYVCWMDADITFHEKNWIDLTIKELKKYIVVQVFKKAKFLGPPPKHEELRADYSFGYSVVHGKVIDQNRYDEWYPHSGYGWAMDINDFRSIGGLPDYDIVGSGDLHFAFSLLNRVSNALEANLHPEFKNFVLDNSQQTFRKLSEISASNKKNIVGYVPMTISHNWHGSRKDRQYVDRWKILIAHQFNYLTDTSKNSDGLLQLNEFSGMQSSGLDKTSLQQDILMHFKMRKEDEVASTDQDRKALQKKVIVVKPTYGLRSNSDDDKERNWRRNNTDVYNHDQFISQSDYPTGDDNCPCPCPTDPNHPNPCSPGHDHHHGSHGSDHHSHGNYGNDYHGTIADCTSQY